MNKNLNIQRNLNYKSINENIKINTKKKKKIVTFYSIFIKL